MQSKDFLIEEFEQGVSGLDGLLIEEDQISTEGETVYLVTGDYKGYLYVESITNEYQLWEIREKFITDLSEKISDWCLILLDRAHDKGYLFPSREALENMVSGTWGTPLRGKYRLSPNRLTDSPKRFTDMDELLDLLKQHLVRSKRKKKKDQFAPLMKIMPTDSNSYSPDKVSWNGFQAELEADGNIRVQHGIGSWVLARVSGQVCSECSAELYTSEAAGVCNTADHRLFWRQPVVIGEYTPTRYAVQGVLSDLIRREKEHPNIARVLGVALALRWLQSETDPPGEDVDIVPIPAVPKSDRLHAHHIAEAFAGVFGKRPLPAPFYKRPDVEIYPSDWAGLKVDKLFSQNVYVWTGGSSVLLIDDVITSGFTMYGAHRRFSELGVSTIPVALARTARYGDGDE